MFGDTVRALNTVTTIVLAGVGYYSGFSRFTHGQYTPSWYAYQLDRAPDDESTRIVPFIDATLATLLLLPQTRLVGTAVSAVFFVISVGMRLQAKKSPITDAGFVVLCLIALWSFAASRRAQQ